MTDLFTQVKKESLEITNDVTTLLWYKEMFDDLLEISNSNPSTIADTEFWNFLANLYTDSVILGIGRQLDEDKRSQSLINLLKLIRDNAELFTKEDYIKHWVDNQGPSPIDYKQVATEEFIDRFGELNHVDPLIVIKDIAILRSATSVIKHERNNFRAHKSKKATKKATFSDVSNSIEILEKLTIKYATGLLDCVYPETLAPVYQGDWKSIFRMPWIT